MTYKKDMPKASVKKSLTWDSNCDQLLFLLYILVAVPHPGWMHRTWERSWMPYIKILLSVRMLRFPWNVIRER